jgi:hypothetical protein
MTTNDDGKDKKTNQHTIQQSTWTSVLCSEVGQVAARHKWHGVAQTTQQHDALRHHTALRHGTTSELHIRNDKLTKDQQTMHNLDQESLEG